jgi:hypothetical protein
MDVGGKGSAEVCDCHHFRMAESVLVEIGVDCVRFDLEEIREDLCI